MKYKPSSHTTVWSFLSSLFFENAQEKNPPSRLQNMKYAPKQTSAKNDTNNPKHQHASKNLNSEGKKSAKKLLSARDKAIPEKKQKTKEIHKKKKKKKLVKKSELPPPQHSKGKRKEI